MTQLLTESCVLAVLGGIAGLVVARWTLATHLVAAAARGHRIAAVRAAAGTSSCSRRSCRSRPGLLFGLFPALHSTQPDLVSAIKAQAGQPSGARAAARFRTSLATAQIALSMALLMAAGLFVKSLLNVSRVDLGLKVDNVVTFGISPELNGYDRARSMAFFERTEQELARIPGVTRRGAPRWCRCWPAATGAATSRSKGFKRGPDTDSNARLQRGQRGVLPHAGRSADGGARVHRLPIRPRHPRSPSSTRRSRRSSTSDATRSAST